MTNPERSPTCYRLQGCKGEPVAYSIQIEETVYRNPCACWVERLKVLAEIIRTWEEEP